MNLREMTKTEQLAWRVFRSAFQDGEDVIVEDSTGNFHYGKMRATHDGIYLERADTCHSSFTDWDDVEFVAHDGFPVSRLRRMTVAEAEDRAEQSDREIIIAALEQAIPRRPAWVGGGCPFVAGPFTLKQIHNRGNIGPEYEYQDSEEYFDFVAKDGARMFSYDTEHLFLNVG
jgi:hypothetical protein